MGKRSLCSDNRPFPEKYTVTIYRFKKKILNPYFKSS